MTQGFLPGDDLIFQLESGFGLLRVIAVENDGERPVWHLLAYEELFPDIDSAQEALTDRAFERTPAARLGNRAVSDQEKIAWQNWIENDGRVSDRSALLMLGLR